MVGIGLEMAGGRGENGSSVKAREARSLRLSVTEYNKSTRLLVHGSPEQAVACTDHSIECNLLISRRDDVGSGRPGVRRAARRGAARRTAARRDLKRRRSGLVQIHWPALQAGVALRSIVEDTTENERVARLGVRRRPKGRDLSTSLPRSHRCLHPAYRTNDQCASSGLYAREPTHETSRATFDRPWWYHGAVALRRRGPSGPLSAEPPTASKRSRRRAGSATRARHQGGSRRAVTTTPLARGAPGAQRTPPVLTSG